MSQQPSKPATDMYQDYEASLAALLAIPGHVEGGDAAAQRSFQDARKAADLSLQQQNARLASLAKSAQSRYDGAVRSLNEHDVLLPSQVHGETGVEGDGQALQRAVHDHVAAVTAVNAQVSAAMRAKDEATRRGGSSRKAVEALQARQQKLRLEREAATEAAQRADLDNAMRKRRRLTAMYAGGAMLSVVIVLLIVSAVY